MALLKTQDDVYRFALECIEIDQEELRIWRERFPRLAMSVSEEARAKIEGRDPDYGPPQMFGSDKNGERT